MAIRTYSNYVKKKYKIRKGQNKIKDQSKEGKRGGKRERLKTE